jgi:hypothetical protein
VSGRTAWHRDGDCPKGALLRLRKHPDALSDALETLALSRGQTREGSSEDRSFQKQWLAYAHVAETLGILPQRCFATRPHRFHDWRGNRGRLRGNPGGAMGHEIGNRTAAQHASVFLAIGRRLTAW